MRRASVDNFELAEGEMRAVSGTLDRNLSRCCPISNIPHPDRNKGCAQVFVPDKSTRLVSGVNAHCCRAGEARTPVERFGFPAGWLNPRQFIPRPLLQLAESFSFNRPFSRVFRPRPTRLPFSRSLRSWAGRLNCSCQNASAIEDWRQAAGDMFPILPSSPSFLSACIGRSGEEGRREGGAVSSWGGGYDSVLGWTGLPHVPIDSTAGVWFPLAPSLLPA